MDEKACVLYTHLSLNLNNNLVGKPMTKKKKNGRKFSCDVFRILELHRTKVMFTLMALHMMERGGREF